MKISEWALVVALALVLAVTMSEILRLGGMVKDLTQRNAWQTEVLNAFPDSCWQAPEVWTVVRKTSK